ncbi:hypothetical protein QBC44DRAFT_158135 [Cladorrhinum sp. PSN332]|nr:hypothetical protein QBC44DRAFT_158135 [Cladorrhinum sp. PSN332]
MNTPPPWVDTICHAHHARPQHHSQNTNTLSTHQLQNMCIGSITRMTCGHLHIIFHDRCMGRCKEPTGGPSYHDQKQQCGNCEASNEIYDIRDGYKKKYNEAMPLYKLAQTMGNVEELERIRTTLRHHALEENRMVSAVRRAGRAKARPRDSTEPVTIHPARTHDPMSFISNAQDAVYRPSSIPREVKDHYSPALTSPSTSSDTTSPETSSPGTDSCTQEVKTQDPLRCDPSFYDIDLDLDLDLKSSSSLPSSGQPGTEVDSGLFFMGFHR